MNMFAVLKKRWPLAITLVLMMGLTVAMPVLAAESNEGEDENVVINQDIPDDYIFAGDTLVVNATIQGDLVAAGDVITIGTAGYFINGLEFDRGGTVKATLVSNAP